MSRSNTKNSIGALLVLTLFAGASGVVYAAEPITITDQSDRQVTLEKPVERVVTIPIPAASMFMALDGSSDKLVGMHSKSKSALEEGILKEIFPESLDIRSDVVGEGFMPNVEELLSVNPDLVFQWAHLGADVVRPIEEAGLKVVTFKYGTEAYARQWLDIMGTILGKKDKSDALIAWRQEKQDAFAEKVANIPTSEKPRVAYFLRFLSSFRVAGKGTYNDFYINLTGGQNVGQDASGFVEVNVEQIMAWDPEVILLNGFEGDLTVDDVYDNPMLAGVSAVKNRRVYKIPLGGYRWDPPNQESPLMWEWLSMVLHPKRFDWPLREDIAEKYRFIYNYDLSEHQIDAILRMQMNGAAANYSQFSGS
ncbi:ABC transporter substrate-binding protein [uncultured Cohaesibacter sp.]|uniref:ABC transporter substrate-binding protein n=1 Tax=uncultured Cohaesibacter sp. TaxID=1002546 RepID=UPI002AA6E760|nr:ABC transporter substrate-binding protein [uncultured Cohaesibacter sp.]